MLASGCRPAADRMDPTRWPPGWWRGRKARRDSRPVFPKQRQALGMSRCWCRTCCPYAAGQRHARASCPGASGSGLRGGSAGSARAPSHDENARRQDQDAGHREVPAAEAPADTLSHLPASSRMGSTRTGQRKRHSSFGIIVNRAAVIVLSVRRWAIVRADSCPAYSGCA
jgi:hypothetical protein